MSSRDGPPRRRSPGGVRDPRVVDTERRRRRPTGVLRAVRPAAPRAGGGRAGGERRSPGARAQAARPRSNVFTREALAPLVGYHAIGHTRYSTTGGNTDATSSPSSSRRCTARWPSPTTATSSTRRACARSCCPGVRADRVQRLGGDDADARRRWRADVGGPHRAHAAGVEGGVLARPAVRRPGARGARPVGVPAAVGRAPAQAATPSPARPAHSPRSAAPTSPRSLLARSSRCRAPRCTAARRSPRPPRGARCTFEFVYFSAPTRCGTAATCTTCARRSASSSPASRRSAPMSVIPVPDSSIPAAIGYAGERRAVQRRADQEPLHRAHVHRADPGDPPARCRPQVQLAPGEPRTAAAS